MNNNTKILYETIGGNISELRKRNNLGQAQLAKLISLSRSSLANIELGNHQPSIFTIYEIALALDCDIFDILPSKDRYRTSINSIDEKFVDIFNSLPDKLSEKNLLFFEKLLEKNKK